MAMGPREQHTALRVLQSFRPGPATNPYLLQLLRSLEESATVETFSWRIAVSGRYDILHVHWPDVLVRGRTRWRSAARTTLFALVLVVARVRRRAIVRTLHNVEPHERLGWAGRRVVKLCDRWTTVWITLTSTATPPGLGVRIPHGHYRDWYDVDDAVRPEPGRAVFFGHIRPYKGVDALLQAAAAVAVEPFSLRLVGRPVDAGVVAEIEAVSAVDDRITARLEYVPDAELAREIAEASLVVLPYRSMVNSGAALLALSLARPVLVPSTPSTLELQHEVGDRWVMLYEGVLTSSIISDALERATSVVGTAQPDLSQRDWSRGAEAHMSVYRQAAHAAR